jgi:GxxExxY protein
LGERVGQHRLDLVVGSALVIEVKAVDKLAKIHVAQTLSYLKSSGHSVGLILNFGDVTLESKRAVRDFRSVASSRCR